MGALWWTMWMLGCGFPPCAGRAESSCGGTCSPVYGSACDGGAETYVGCVPSLGNDACDDITWACAPADTPDSCVRLPCRHSGLGWKDSCPGDAISCGQACPSDTGS